MDAHGVFAALLGGLMGGVLFEVVLHRITGSDAYKVRRGERLRAKARRSREGRGDA